MKKNNKSKYEAEIKEAYKKLEKSYEEVKNSYEEMIFRLALVAEYKDDTTGTHLVRIADYSTEIAHSLGLSPEQIDTLRYASPMHDIGKLIIADDILKKTSGLNDQERKIIEKHALIGANISRGVNRHF